MADAERLGGFSLGRESDGTVASIDQMRSELASELRMGREDTKALRQQVADLITTIRETSKEQTTATQDAATKTSLAVTNALESVGR
ncbi:MAG: hypothetical protein IPH30_17065 [Betaproteobacteria bacterium]|nr:hypothetical protein [Betaproteobacteria bacterium]